MWAKIFWFGIFLYIIAVVWLAVWAFADGPRVARNPLLDKPIPPAVLERMRTFGRYRYKLLPDDTLMVWQREQWLYLRYEKEG